MAQSQWEWFCGALAAGPVYGWLGAIWRSRRAASSALAAAAALMLEPLSRLVYHSPGLAVAYATEIGTGIVLGGFFLTSRRRWGHGSAPHPSGGE